jgi:glycosyltransferase involved in cell wall biosynthesis
MDSPLRIAFINSWKGSAFAGSGTAVGIANLAVALRRLGHELDLIRPPANTGEARPRLDFNLRLPGLLRSRPRYDLIVGFDMDGFRWASTTNRPCPYVVCLKGIAADEARFARSPCERVGLSALAWLERGNARGADRVIVPSGYSARIARSCYGVMGPALRIVPEAVDLRLWTKPRSTAGSARTRAPTIQPTILSVARQYPRKDTATLIRALPRVLEVHPRARLVVIGGGPELPRLRALVTLLGLDDVVSLRGAVERDEDVRAAFLDAQVFCLPSRQEGFGIVFVEAMAAGLPIVAARSAAVPEVVSHGETGILVAPGNVRALGDALTNLLGDPEERVRLGDAGIQKANALDLATVGPLFIQAALSEKER